MQSTYSGFGFINSENVFKVRAGVAITVDRAAFTCRGRWNCPAFTWVARETVPHLVLLAGDMQTASEDLGYLGCPDMDLAGLPLGWACPPLMGLSFWFGQVCDEPHPLLVKEMIQHCVSADIDEAYKVGLALS